MRTRELLPRAVAPRSAPVHPALALAAAAASPIAAAGTGDTRLRTAMTMPLCPRCLPSALRPSTVSTAMAVSCGGADNVERGVRRLPHRADAKSRPSAYRRQYQISPPSPFSPATRLKSSIFCPRSPARGARFGRTHVSGLTASIRTRFEKAGLSLRVQPQNFRQLTALLSSSPWLEPQKTVMESTD